MKFYKRLKLFAVAIQIFFFSVMPFVFVSDEEITDKTVFVFITVFEIIIMTFLIIYYKSKIAEISFQDDYALLTRNDKVIIKELKIDCSKITFSEFSGKIVMYFGNRKYEIQKYYNVTYKPIFDFSVLNNENFPNADIKKY